MIAHTTMRFAHGALAIIVMVSLGACGGQPVHPATVPAQPYETGRGGSEDVPLGARAARIAANQVGIPYRYGGNTPQGFDCSGLVHFAYARAGMRVPRTTARLWTGTTPVQRRDMQSGDLVFFRIDGKMSHVGMYLGDGRFVHAPSSGRTVSVESLDSPFYRQAFLRAGRPY